MLLNLFMILSLIGVVAVVRIQKRGGSVHPSVVYGLVALSIMLSGVRLYRWKNPSTAFLADPPEFPIALGYAFGREVARAVPGGGDILVILYPDEEEGAPVERGWEPHLEGIRQGLGEGPYRVVTTAPTSEEAATMAPLTMRFYARLLRAAPEAKAIISFLGAPVSDTPGGAGVPPLYVIHVNPEMLRPMMTRGTIGAVVVPRSGIDFRARPQPGMTLEEVFDMRYTLVTAP